MDLFNACNFLTVSVRRLSADLLNQYFLIFFLIVEQKIYFEIQINHKGEML